MLLSYRPADSVDFYGIRKIPPPEENLELLRSWGVEMPTMRFLKGMPIIEYRDLTKEPGEKIDMDDFKGSITIPNWIDASLDLHFVPETIRLTVVKWGKEKGQIGKITIAPENWMGAFSIISYCGVTLDKNQTFAAGVVIMDCCMNPVDPEKPAGLDNCYMAPVHVQENVWLGAHTIIMPGVTVGHHCTIGSRSVITKDIPPHCVAVGNPATIVTRYVK